MATQRTQAVSRTTEWSEKKRYKVNDSENYNGNVYQNVTGYNSEPGAGNDWVLLSQLGIKDVFAGTNITIDKTDPINPIINASGGSSLNTESVTIDNFWNHGSSFNFLRSNSNLAGFNRETLDQSTGSTTIVMADILASSSLYATSRSKYISKVLIDCHGVSGTVTEWEIALRAYQKIDVVPYVINIIDIGDFTFTKGIGQHGFASITPTPIEIPEDYLVTCFLRKTTGTGFDIKAVLTFKFEDYAS